MKGLERIITERRQQIDREGYSTEHDDKHPLQDFLNAAASYAMCLNSNDAMPVCWPWERAAWKPKDRLRNLERAGALYLAAAEYSERHGDDSKAFRNAAEGTARMIDNLLTNNCY